MERTERINGAQPIIETYSVRDNATGKVRYVREMLDPELARFAEAMSGDILRLRGQLSGVVRALVQAERMHSSVCYEMERRAKALSIATELPQRSLD